MFHRRFTIPLLTLLMMACMKPNPLVEELAADESESGTETETETGDGDGDGDAEPAASCELAELFEPACDACLAEACCDLAGACAADPDCACLAECELAGGNVGTCKVTCGAAKPSEIEALQPLLDCVADVCAASC